MPSRQSPQSSLEQQVEQSLRSAGWKIVRESGAGPGRADLVIRRGSKAFIVEVKRLSEARADRALPLLSQAVLEARAFAAADPERRAPMAMLAVGHSSARLIDAVEKFVREYAPDVAVGLVDQSGLRLLTGPGLEPLRKLPEPGWSWSATAEEPAVSQLFSDLNQWLLKVLLAPRIPEALLGAPRGDYSNASQLASAAGVSVMSAFRFVRQLRAEGFLHESSPTLRLVRLEPLLLKWQAASMRSMPESRMQWLLPEDPGRQLHDALSLLETDARAATDLASSSRHRTRASRACLALFAAADALGLGFVHGATPHVYLERLDRDTLDRLGVVPAKPGASPDLLVRRPAVRESVFRGCVRRDGVPVADVLQVWLDVAAHPARGREQADAIHRRVIATMLKA